MAAIIRKPPQPNTKPSDPTNDAVAAINKNKALTVTARSVVATTAAAAATASSSKTPPVPAGVNNSITVSPILSSKKTGNSVTITPQLVQQTAQKASTSSPIPIALTKANLNQTTITKSPTPLSKPNGLGPRNSKLSITALKTKTPNVVSPIPSSTKLISSNNNNNNSRGVSPKVLVSTQTSHTKSPFKPILAQTKAQALAAQNTNKLMANVIPKPKPTTSVTQQSTANANQILANKLNSLGVEMRKRPANETISSATAKKPKTGSSASSVS